MTRIVQGLLPIVAAGAVAYPLFALGGQPATLPYGELERISLALSGGDHTEPTEAMAMSADASRSGYTPATSATECAECHMVQFLQWDEGRTGHMFPTEVYTGGTKTAAMHRLAFLDYTFYHHFEENGKKDACLRCHVPATVYSAATVRGTYAPASRSLSAENATEGITCVSCHLDQEGNIRGEHSYSTSEADHAVLADNVMFGDGHTMCASCHGDPFWGALADTSRQWETQAQSTGLTCVDCHMVSLDDMTSPSHAFPGAHSETMIGGAYSLEIPQEMEEGEPFTVEVCNEFAGHNLPTGDQFRAYVFKFDVRGSGGFEEEVWVSPVFKTPIMREAVYYNQVDPIPFLECRDLVYPELRDGTYNVDYEVGFWLLKPAKVEVLFPPWADDLEGEGEVYRVLESGSFQLRVND